MHFWNSFFQRPFVLAILRWSATTRVGEVFLKDTLPRLNLSMLEAKNEIFSLSLSCLILVYRGRIYEMIFNLADVRRVCEEVSYDWRLFYFSFVWKLHSTLHTSHSHLVLFRTNTRTLRSLYGRTKKGRKGRSRKGGEDVLLSLSSALAHHTSRLQGSTGDFSWEWFTETTPPYSHPQAPSATYGLHKHVVVIPDGTRLGQRKLFSCVYTGSLTDFSPLFLPFLSIFLLHSCFTRQLYYPRDLRNDTQKILLGTFFLDPRTFQSK